MLRSLFIQVLALVTGMWRGWVVARPVCWYCLGFDQRGDVNASGVCESCEQAMFTARVEADAWMDEALEADTIHFHCEYCDRAYPNGLDADRCVCGITPVLTREEINRRIAARN